jgi:hypothetical protein
VRVSARVRKKSEVLAPALSLTLFYVVPPGINLYRNWFIKNSQKRKYQSRIVFIPPSIS